MELLTPSLGLIFWSLVFPFGILILVLFKWVIKTRLRRLEFILALFGVLCLLIGFSLRISFPFVLTLGLLAVVCLLGIIWIEIVLSRQNTTKPL